MVEAAAGAFALKLSIFLDGDLTELSLASFTGESRCDLKVDDLSRPPSFTYDFTVDLRAALYGDYFSTGFGLGFGGSLFHLTRATNLRES